MKKYMMIGALLALPCVGFAGDKEDAELVEGIRTGNVAMVQNAMDNGARLNQQLNDAGQTPLALAQELRDAAENENFEAMVAIVHMLQEQFAPIYVMYHPAYDGHGDYIEPNRTTGNQGVEIFREDIGNFLMLIDGVGCGHASQ